MPSSLRAHIRRLTGLSLVVAALLATIITVPRAAQPDRTAFALGGVQVPPGQRVDVDLAVPAGTSDPATTVLVTVFHGARPGRVLALTAGVHGFEYAPILARAAAA